jgi:uncharacterized membrane protein
MISSPNDAILFLGRFHPVLVHLPIGGLVLLGVLELLAKFPRFKGAAQNNRLILGLTTAASLITASLGWMLSQSGDYDAQLVHWHKWAGFGVVVGCAGTLLLSWLSRPWVSRLSLLATLAVLVVASHLGSSITHGRGFLTRYALGAFRTLGGGNGRAPAAPRLHSDLTRQPVFGALIQPILQRRCSACHGLEKRKADLSVETYEALLKGGKDGPVLIAGKAFDSPVIQRLLLPLSDEDHMPPEGKPQPTPAEIMALQWWIDCGAPPAKTVGDLKPGPEVLRILGAAQAEEDQEQITRALTGATARQ